MTTDIMNDKRTIWSITSVFAHCARYSINDQCHTKIVPYEEPSGVSTVTWFAVYEGGEIRYRVPAATFVVEYAPAEEEVAF